MRTQGLFKEYIKYFWQGWWGIVISGVGGLDWIIRDFLGVSLPSVPSWTRWVIVVVGIVIAQFIAFYKMRKERNEALQRLELINEQTTSEADLKLREMRIKVRNTKVAEIPEILLNMRREVMRIVDELKCKKVNPNILASITIDTLGLKKGDTLLHRTPDDKSMEMLKSKMGLKKGGKQKAQNWQLLMAENIDNYQIGITQALSDKYKSDRAKLDEIIITSDKKLDEKIENYLKKLIALHNLRLYTHYAQATEDPLIQEYFQKPKSKGLARNVEVHLLQDIRHSLQEVLMELEKYQTGEALNGNV